MRVFWNVVKSCFVLVRLMCFWEMKFGWWWWLRVVLLLWFGLFLMLWSFVMWKRFFMGVLIMVLLFLEMLWFLGEFFFVMVVRWGVGVVRFEIVLGEVVVIFICCWVDCRFLSFVFIFIIDVCMDFICCFMVFF